MYLQGDQIDVTPEVCCYRCHHLYYDMYSGDMCQCNGVSGRAAFSFKGFGEETRSISCPKFAKRSQTSQGAINVMSPELEEDENYLRFMKSEGRSREMIDGVWVWFRNGDEDDE